LGITHSAGNGPFDHWYDLHDMIGYKFLIGNLSVMPILGKAYDYSVAQGAEVQDMIWDVQYDNSETESAIGFLHQTRTSSQEANDAPYAAYRGSSIIGGWKTQHVNVFLSRGFEDVKIKLEAGFESGSTGIGTAAGDEVSLNGYGVALELDFPNPQSKWHWQVRSGIASGDNPSTTNYEGFHFDRNYDVAFMMFNHPLGRYDLFRTANQRSPDRLHCATNATTCGNYATDEALDDEAISNAIYFSPKLFYKMSDQWEWVNSLTWAQLQTNPLEDKGVDPSKDLGFEWDTSFVFKPHDRIMWVNELGFLFPGEAWTGASYRYGNSFTYGFNSKAVISF
ncbi:MAG: hypothetical protein COT73_00225, partial [Bdellovibrio sp. CG10_big_fil_rev_8_21_14_0_10_47_8]